MNLCAFPQSALLLSHDKQPPTLFAICVVTCECGLSLRTTYFFVSVRHVTVYIAARLLTMRHEMKFINCKLWRETRFICHL